MQTRILFMAVPAALFAAAAQAGPYDQAYSIINTEYKRAADPLERKVIVNRVDGVNSRDNESVVAPGPHEVILDLPPRQGFHQATQVTQDWKPAVKYDEEIKECSAKYLKGGKS